MRLPGAALAVAVTMLSVVSTAYGFVAPEKSCIYDQFFPTCLDMYDAGDIVNNTYFINNSYYNITGGSGDSYWLPYDASTIRPNGTYGALVFENFTVTPWNQFDAWIYMEGMADSGFLFGYPGLGTQATLKWSHENGQFETDQIWAFGDTVSFTGAVAGSPVIGVTDLYTYGDIYTTGAGDDLWLGGLYASQAEMIIQQDGNVNFKTPNFTISSTGEVGIGTNAPAEMLDVNGNVTADDFITKSLAYSGDATTLLSGIRPEVYDGGFTKVDHSTMGELAVNKEYYIPIKQYKNVTVCDDVQVPTNEGTLTIKNVCRTKEVEEVIGYDTRSYQGVSLDKTIAVLIKANQELTQRVQVLEERLGVKA